MFNWIWNFFKAIFSGHIFGDIRDMIFSAAMYLIYRDSFGNDIELTNVDVINIFIQLGMVIIIWYGVMKIVLNVVWKLFFGKKFEWKVGILEIFLRRLRPVFAQSIIDQTEDDLEEKTDRYVASINKVARRIRKDNTRRCCTMSVIKNLLAKLNVNKKTNTAVGTIGALAVSVGGYFASDVGVIQQAYDAMGISPAGVLAATSIAAVALVIPGVLGTGRQTKEQFEIMLEKKKVERLAKKVAKTAGVPKKTQADRAADYAKKNNISVALAMQIVKEQDAKAQADAAQKREAREEKVIASIAKKSKVSIEMAKQIRIDQLTKIAK